MKSSYNEIKGMNIFGPSESFLLFYYHDLQSRMLFVTCGFICLKVFGSLTIDFF
jgi:hypothetical protein